MNKKTADNKANYKDCLTSELLLKHFPSQFDLVRHAIQLAGLKVEEESKMAYPSDESRNIATESLEDIAECGCQSLSNCDEDDECEMLGQSDCEDGDCEDEMCEEEVKPKSKRKAKA